MLSVDADVRKSLRPPASPALEKKAAPAKQARKAKSAVVAQDNDAINRMTLLNQPRQHQPTTHLQSLLWYRVRPTRL